MKLSLLHRSCDGPQSKGCVLMLDSNSTIRSVTEPSEMCIGCTIPSPCFSKTLSATALPSQLHVRRQLSLSRSNSKRLSRVPLSSFTLTFPLPLHGGCIPIWFIYAYTALHCQIGTFNIKVSAGTAQQPSGYGRTVLKRSWNVMKTFNVTFRCYPYYHKMRYLSLHRYIFLLSLNLGKMRT
eukprot:SAG31_NODE_1310_length_8870_cov_2.332231_2_plen_181_part_00